MCLASDIPFHRLDLRIFRRSPISADRRNEVGARFDNGATLDIERRNSTRFNDGAIDDLSLFVDEKRKLHTAALVLIQGHAGIIVGTEQPLKGAISCLLQIGAGGTFGCDIPDLPQVGDALIHNFQNTIHLRELE